MFVFVRLSCLFFAALWSPAGKGLTFGPLVFSVVTLPYGTQGQVWYLVVSFPNICPLLYFSQNRQLEAYSSCLLHCFCKKIVTLGITFLCMENDFGEKQKILKILNKNIPL